MWYWAICESLLLVFSQALAVVERISNSSVRPLEGAAVGQP